MPISANNTNVSFNTVSFKKRQKGVQIITKPIDKVETIVNNTVDKFAPEQKDEEKKKSHKTAVRVGSTVLVLSALVAFLNPKVSSKLVEKMKTASVKYRNKAKNSDDFMGKLYRCGGSIFSKGAKVLNFSNNYNTVKDECFKWLCEKTKILKRPHNIITEWFDKIGKQTVYRKYSKAQTSIEVLKNEIIKYKSKLPKSEQEKLQKIFDEIKTKEDFLTKVQVEKRLKQQEQAMSELEQNARKQIRSYAKGFWGKNKKKHVRDNMYFWAEKILQPVKEKVEKEGSHAVNNFIGIAEAEKGLYNNTLELIYPHINSDEKVILDNLLNSASKKLRSANKSECIKYFDKKRDLMLGSAPTDILTALIGLTASGIVISNADNKEDRISKILTVAFPAIAGLGVSMGMTAMLFSGIKGMAIGAASGGLLSLIGNKINNNFVKNHKGTREAVNA